MLCNPDCAHSEVIYHPLDSLVFAIINPCIKLELPSLFRFRNRKVQKVVKGQVMQITPSLHTPYTSDGGSVVSSQYTRVTDRHTDWWMDGRIRTDTAQHRILRYA